MDDKEFRGLIHRIVDQFELEPDAAETLLRKILKMLFGHDSRGKDA